MGEKERIPGGFKKRKKEKKQQGMGPLTKEKKRSSARWRLDNVFGFYESGRGGGCGFLKINGAEERQVPTAQGEGRPNLRYIIYVRGGFF